MARMPGKPVNPDSSLQRGVAATCTNCEPMYVGSSRTLAPALWPGMLDPKWVRESHALDYSSSCQVNPPWDQRSFELHTSVVTAMPRREKCSDENP